MSAASSREPPDDDNVCMPSDAVLICIKGGEVFERHELVRSVTIFGRSSAVSHIVGDHASLSRAHAAIKGSTNGIHLCDLGSTHGTFLNGQRLTAHTDVLVTRNDLVSFGASNREYYIIPSAPPPESTAVPIDVAGASRAEREAEIRAAIASFAVPLPVSHRSETVTDEVVAEEKKQEEEAGEDSDEFGIVDYDGGADGAAERTSATAGGHESSHIAIERRMGSADDNGETEGERNDNNETEAQTAIVAAARAPLLYEVLLSPHYKACTVVAFDPSGARLASGSVDGAVQLFDFGGLSPTRKPFRSLPPSEGAHAVTAVAWSDDGGFFAVGTGSARLRVYSRDAAPAITTVQGDSYVMDAAHTKGHRGAVTGVAFAAASSSRFFSSSADGTVRFWDIEQGKRAFGELTCTDVYKFRGAKGARSGIGAFSLSPDGGTVLVGCSDGSVQLSRVKGAGARAAWADASRYDAHSGKPIVAAEWASNGLLFATRGNDGTVSIWDSRQFGSRANPVTTWNDLPESEGAALAWSPDCQLLAVGSGGGGRGCSANEREAAGWVYLLDGTTTFCRASPARSCALRSVCVTPGSAILTLSWQSRTNQLAVGSADGSHRVLFDPKVSSKGALLAAARFGLQELGSDVIREVIASDGFGFSGDGLADSNYDHIIAPFAEAPPSRKKGGQPVSSRPVALPAKPAPVPTPHPALSKQTFTDHYLQSHPEVLRTNVRAQDPQALLQSYAGVSGGFTSAYAKTQPKTILAETTLEEEIDKERMTKRVKRTEDN
jgi:WD40 repeat protein/pSer/pThr/pTyr-binding forkhead associated (FHA) protein